MKAIGSRVRYFIIHSFLQAVSDGLILGFKSQQGFSNTAWQYG
ncbi:Uncharacterised protein [Mycobacteroides abscessus subsp. massiliense]|nr:Uncharacterised protein [Mycobacteroides abscessus subsp. massiliense]